LRILCGEGGLASLIPLWGGFRSRNPPVLRTGVFSFLELNEVNFARSENEKPAAFAAGFGFLAVRAGFELMIYIFDIQYFKNILCQG
jgi:hypothetical protein